MWGLGLADTQIKKREQMQNEMQTVWHPLLVCWALARKDG